MEDVGFQGTGSRFGSRFESGSPILAKQLNDLSTGIQSSLPMPYLGEGTSVSFVPGGSLITSGNLDIPRKGKADQYFNQFKCIVEESPAVGGGTIWTLQIVSGSMIYADEHQAHQVSMTEVWSLSPVDIITGTDPKSIFTNHGGYCVLNTDLGADYGVYLLQTRSQDSEKFVNYLYVADTIDFNYPSTGFVAYGVDGDPPGINLPTTAYSLQVMEIAYISWDAENEVFDLNQELIGSQTLPVVEQIPQFKVDIINQNKDIETAPSWVVRVAKGSVLLAQGDDGCIGHEIIKDIDINCDPIGGLYPDSPWMSDGGYYGSISNDTDYDVWLFRIKTSGGITNSLWVGPHANYTHACPVVLPVNIDPGIDYTAQAIHIAGMEQPYAADVWVINQVIQGSITFPDYAPSTPFFVTKYGVGEWSVSEGTVNNILPDNINDVIPLATDGYVWLEVTFTSPEPTAVDSVLINAGDTIPDDTDSVGYIALAHIIGGESNQLVTGSLWSLRVQYGTTTPKYYFNRI